MLKREALKIYDTNIIDYHCLDVQGGRIELNQIDKFYRKPVALVLHYGKNWWKHLEDKAFVNYYDGDEWHGDDYNGALKRVEELRKKYPESEWGVQEIWEDEDGNEIDGWFLCRYELCYHWKEDEHGNRISLENERK